MFLSDVINHFHQRIMGLGTRRVWLAFLLVPFLLVIAINGIGLIPEEHYQRLSENLFVARTDIHPDNYFQETLTLPLLANLMGVTSRATFNALCFIIVLLFIILFAWLASLRENPGFALIVSTLLITGPAMTILLSWIGSPDGLTFLLIVPFIYSTAGSLLFLLGILGAANHPSFIIAIFQILVLRWLGKDGITFRHILSAGAGNFLGFIGVRIFLDFNQIQVTSRYDFLFDRTLHDWFRMSMTHLPISFFSLFNVQWLVLIICAIMFYRSDKRFFLFAFVFLAANLVITYFTLDTTRVFSLLSTGIYFVIIFHSYTISKQEMNLEKEFVSALMLIALFSIFSPRYFAWAGEIHTTPFYEFIRGIMK